MSAPKMRPRVRMWFRWWTGCETTVARPLSSFSRKGPGVELAGFRALLFELEAEDPINVVGADNVWAVQKLKMNNNPHSIILNVRILSRITVVR